MVQLRFAHGILCCDMNLLTNLAINHLMTVLRFTTYKVYLQHSNIRSKLNLWPIFLQLDFLLFDKFMRSNERLCFRLFPSVDIVNILYHCYCSIFINVLIHNIVPHSLFYYNQFVMIVDTVVVVIVNPV